MDGTHIGRFSMHGKHSLPSSMHGTLWSRPSMDWIHIGCFSMHGTHWLRRTGRCVAHESARTFFVREDWIPTHISRTIHFGKREKHKHCNPAKAWSLHCIVKGYKTFDAYFLSSMFHTSFRQLGFPDWCFLKNALLPLIGLYAGLICLFFWV